MTVRQKRFCDEYLISLNATQAAIKAGYSPEGAGRNADRMMKNDEIKAYISERIEQLRNERTATAAEVVEFLTEVMRDEDEGAASRLKAAELLGKRYGLFTDKVNVSGSGAVQIVDDIPDG